LATKHSTADFWLAVQLGAVDWDRAGGAAKAALIRNTPTGNNLDIFIQ
jgi:hypothetical protein